MYFVPRQSRVRCAHLHSCGTLGHGSAGEASRECREASQHKCDGCGVHFGGRPTKGGYLYIHSAQYTYKEGQRKWLNGRLDVRKLQQNTRYITLLWSLPCRLPSAKRNSGREAICKGTRCLCRGCIRWRYLTRET